MKSFIRKLVPKGLLSQYHRFLAVLAAFYYGHPSRKMTVIGVTGTNGKSTTVNLIGRILEEAGYKVGWTSTMNFKVAEKEWLNDKKMTMLGRFQLQKLLRQMVKAGCQYAIIETSSEGIKQHRHLGIDYRVAVFTNLTPEHIEAHGSFEKYKEAKGELFNKLKFSRKNTASIINLDDPYSHYFLQFPVGQRYGFGINFAPPAAHIKNLKAGEIELRADGSSFQVRETRFKLKLPGEFNIYNALAAIATAYSQGIDLETSRRALEKIDNLPGRMEFIDIGQKFKVLVDYAYEPVQLTKVYEIIKRDFQPKKIIQVLGPTGGGRDQARIPVLGQMASEFADLVIITTDDPYDEDPNKLADKMIAGVDKANCHKILKILDRDEAIKKAISEAREGDLVLITGKGCDQAICVADGKKIAWDDREAARRYLKLRVKS